MSIQFLVFILGLHVVDYSNKLYFAYLKIPNPKYMYLIGYEAISFIYDPSTLQTS